MNIPKYQELEDKVLEQAVQLANAESKCRELAAENSYRLPKAASELSNAWVLHKYLIGILAAIMGSKKSAQEWLYGTIAGPGFEFPDVVAVGDDIDAWTNRQMRDSINHSRVFEIIKAETLTTYDFLGKIKVRASNCLHGGGYRYTVILIVVGLKWLNMYYWTKV